VYTKYTSPLTLWTNVEIPYGNVARDGNNGQYGDNGNNSATIVITDKNWSGIDGGTNNLFNSCGLQYKFNNTTSWTNLSSNDNRPIWKVYVGRGCTKLDLQNVYAYGSLDRKVSGQAYGQSVKYYSRPNKPTNLNIKTSVNK
jgi:hypothetical protein